MSAIRSTTAAQAVREASDRPRAASRTAPQPVGLAHEADADRRRSLNEELLAAEDRFPTFAPEDAMVETRDVVEELGRMGSEAVRVLQPLNEKAMRLINRDQVDEQA
jgi:hypothetical protein